MPHDEKQAAYAADITYGTNNEFGFDYLRDNMVYQMEEKVQRRLAFAIVDEVDSILIDEARTPLIISGQAEDNTDSIPARSTLVPPRLIAAGGRRMRRATIRSTRKRTRCCCPKPGMKRSRTSLTEMGLLPAGGSLYDAANITLMHHVYAALRAHALYHRDQHYVVQNGEVIIVDEFTGRLMCGPALVGRPAPGGGGQGRRGDPEGKPDAGVDHLPELFPHVQQAGRHDRHGGYRGLRIPEIYNLETVVIPTHRPMIRKDMHDQVYLTAKEKYQAVINDIRDCHAARPAGAGRHHLDRDQRAAVRPADTRRSCRTRC